MTLDVRRCHAGDRLPASLSSHAGLILLGGEMGAYDDARYPWLTEAKHLVRHAVETSVPFLGICLGHQLAAVALGGRVAGRAAGTARGLLPVGRVTGADDPLVNRLDRTARLLHWNSDTVASPPPGATVLATDPDGEVQMVRFASLAWGVQGHPEADVAIVTSWGQSDGSAPTAGAAGSALVAELEGAQPALLASWGPVAAGFFEAVRTAPGAQPAVR